ncbi:MAG: PadR family transcriptional regulator [Spirochaetales bacterium]|nr:PadR family transcriptional regulator [Spirochaetales bacterium]
MLSISNAEFVVLSLLYEQGPVSGYTLNKLIHERGYRNWADIGSTSVYTGLKKLEKKALVEGRLVKEEHTKGPHATVFSLLDKGLVLLREETAWGLSRTRERDRGFDLALSAMNTIPRSHRRKLLTLRRDFLQAEYVKLTTAAETDTGVDWRGELLSTHTLSLIQCEIAFVQKLINSMGEDNAAIPD